MALQIKFAQATEVCLYEKLGCHWCGPYQDLEEHTGKCEKEMTLTMTLKQENHTLKEDIETLKEEIKKMKKDEKEEIDELKNEIKKLQAVNPQVGPSAKPNTSRTFFDFSAGGEHLGRVVVYLFNNLAPQTCAKFVGLCSNEKGVSYRGSKVSHITSSYCQMGHEDHLTYPSSGRVFPSEYETQLENKSFNHSRPRIVVMNKMSGDVTKSIFFVTFQPHTGWDGRHVPIGEVTEGWSVIEKIKQKGVNEVLITNCGVIID